MSYNEAGQNNPFSFGVDGQRDSVYNPELDETLECLSNHRRREVLLLLKEGEIENIEELLDHEVISATEIELIHCHLPKLAESDYIEWGRQSGDVSKGEAFDWASSVLDVIENNVGELPADWPES